MNKFRIISPILLFVAIPSLAVACSSKDDSTEVSSDNTTTTSTEAPSGEPTCAGSPETLAGSPGEDQDVSVINSLELAQTGFGDSIAFSFSTNEAPEYEVSAAQPPFYQEGSGDEVTVAGNDFVKITLRRATSFDSTTNSVATASQLSSDETNVVAEVVRTGDFEGQVTYIVGLRETCTYSASTGSEPGTLTINFPAS